MSALIDILIAPAADQSALNAEAVAIGIDPQNVGTMTVPCNQSSGPNTAAATAYAAMGDMGDAQRAKADALLSQYPQVIWYRLDLTNKCLASSDSTQVGKPLTFAAALALNGLQRKAAPQP